MNNNEKIMKALIEGRAIREAKSNLLEKIKRFIRNSESDTFNSHVETGRDSSPAENMRFDYNDISKSDILNSIDKFLDDKNVSGVYKQEPFYNKDNLLTGIKIIFSKKDGLDKYRLYIFPCKENNKPVKEDKTPKITKRAKVL